MQDLPYRLDRTVLISAKREIVFRFFTDSARWAAWWGPRSTIEARPGGKVYIRHPNGVEVLGEVLDVRQPELLVFTYGFATGKPITPGSSRVTIRLESVEAGTRLQLLHEFAEAGPRDQHVQGWRFQLSLFSNAVANDIYADAATAVDGWFDAWSVADDRAREEALSRIVTAEISFRDRYSLLDGLADLTAHIGASLRFTPGIVLRRKGDVRQCQGTILSDWVATGNDGQERMTGTNVFEVKPDGRIDRVTGFTSQ